MIKNAKENGFENAGFVDQYKLSYLFKDENNQMFLHVLPFSIDSGRIGSVWNRGTKWHDGQSTQRDGSHYKKKIVQTILCATVLLSIYVPYYATIWRDLLELDASLVLNGV